MDERTELSIAPQHSGEVASPVDAVAATFEPQPFRTHVRRQDVDAIEALTRRTAVFNEEEVEVACELAEETLAKGEETAGYYFLFADGEDGLDGYACLGPIPGTNRRWELYWIAVDPEKSGRGLGRRLQLAVEELARGLGAVYLVAETSTRPPYEAARRFYRANDFDLLAEVPDWHDDGDGMAIFRKRL